MKTSEPPLFVLKYRPGVRVKWTLCPIPFIYAIGIQIVAIPTESQWDPFEVLLRLGSSYVVVLLIVLLGELILFREIRVYKDRIVKSWGWLGERKVAWVHASFHGFGVRGFTARGRRVSDPSTNVDPIFHFAFARWFVPRFGGVSYNESFAAPQDVRKLNELLAEISGRDVVEFEPLCFKMDRFIKEETR